MRRTRFWGLIGLLAAFGVGAKGHPLPNAAAVRAASAQTELPQARQRLQQHHADIEKLEQAVARQESDRKQASQRLQQQDEAITALREQLQALQDAKPENRQH